MRDLFDRLIRERESSDVKPPDRQS